MSEETTTPQSGSDALDVGSAATAFESMMDASEAPAEATQQDTPEATAQDTDGELTADDIEDESPEAEGQDEPEEDEPRKWRVKAAGEELEVSEDELVRGYQRHIDYTRKSQELAETRKAVEAEQARVREATQQADLYIERLGQLDELLAQQDISDQQLEELKQNDEIGYMRAMMERQQNRERRQAITQEVEQVQQQQAAVRAKALQEHVAAQAEHLRQAMPRYFDKEAGPKMRKQMRDYANEIGAPQENLDRIYNAWEATVLWEASEYRRLVKNKQAAVKQTKEAPKMLKPGSSNAKQTLGDEQVKKAKAQLKRTGKVSDAASLFERFL